MKEEKIRGGGGGGGDEGVEVSIWDCGSPLYDTFELVSFSHLLDRHVMTLPFTHGSSIKQVSELGKSRKMREMNKNIDRNSKTRLLKMIFGSIVFWRRH